MKILIIDSHKGSLKEPQNLHWLNSKLIKDYLESLGHYAKLIWSYPTVNDNIEENFDIIILNHASHYCYTDKLWLDKSPNAKLFYVLNDFSLGEPRIIWMAAKEGRKYEVISSVEGKISKVVEKYVSKWHYFVNLNSLVIKEKPVTYHGLYEKQGCIYYGSYRKDRAELFKKYLTGDITISTHIKNREKYNKLGINGPFINRIDWNKNGLSDFKTSLYIEDETSHKHFTGLANRFYESLNYDVIPIFDEKCANTIKLSGYSVPPELICKNGREALEITNGIGNYNGLLELWRTKALIEKQLTLEQIFSIIST